MAMTTKVLLFTSQDIGNDVFSYLHARDDIELTVVTQRTQRDEIYGYRATLDLCLEKSVTALTPKEIDNAFLTQVEAMAPDLIICAYYPRIFPRRLLKIPPLGCVNVHPGLLPHYRGTFPTPWCILNNEKEIGVTLHYMDEGIDTGDILVQQLHPIGPDETGHELYKRSMKLCADLLIGNVDKLLRNELPARKQPAGGSYYNRIARQYRIDWHQSRSEIRNQIRVHAKPYFPAYAFLLNKCVTINKASFIDLEDYRAQGSGTICKVFENMNFVVSCVDGCLLIEDYDLFPILRPDDVALHIRPGNRF
jgi:methionyl-tRNA formyltransferase